MEKAWRIFYLQSSASSLQKQLQGQPLSVAQADALRDDVSTDEITPVAIMSHYDETLGRFVYTGLTVQGERPIAAGAVQSAGFNVVVAGERYGKGSSREHSPTAEMYAGIRVVFAKSFERIYRQNADNIGLITCTDFTLLERMERGEEVSPDELVAGREPLAQAIVKAGGLLRLGRQTLRDIVQREDQRLPTRPQTLFEKIVALHRLQTPITPAQPQTGDGIFVKADWCFIHEYYTGMAAHMLRREYGDGYRLYALQSIVVFEDHSSYLEQSPAHLKNGLVPNMHRMRQAQRDFVALHGLRSHVTLTDDEAARDDGSNVAGISHAMMAEHYALPGQLVAGTDSHTPHSGALGCVAYGVGTTDMANAFMTGALRLTLPKQMRIRLNGALPIGVMAKDVMLHLLALPEIRRGDAIGCAIEFCGEAVSSMSVDERATLTNMCAELGGTTGIVAPDVRTQEFLLERRGVKFEIEPWMKSDDNAHYAHSIEVDCTKLEPFVARPGDPGRGLPMSQLNEEVRIDIAYGGSCTAGKREDFDHYHAVLAWGVSKGMRLPLDVTLYLQYGTTAVRDYCIARGYDKTFAAIGARILQPSCGACANCGPGSSKYSSQVTVSAINRNFPGRSGPGLVWLASPSTVMASALAGKLISFEALQRTYQAMPITLT